MDSVSQREREMIKRKKGDEVNPFLPEDIIINILSKLPAKNALQCRLVCKRWNGLTLDRDFVDLHCRNRISPTILVAYPRFVCNSSELHFFCLDKWWEPSLMFHRFPFYSGKFPHKSTPLFSHAGLIVFQEYQNYCPGDAIFVILNPTSHENVRITLSEKIRGSQIYGVFFHPVLNEYCSLWNICLSLKHPKQNHFKMLSLGPNPSFKTISYPFSHRFKQFCAYPLFIDTYLYWILEPEQTNMMRDYTCNDIMEFSILSEEFRVLSCPVPLQGRCSLLNIDGTLAFVRIYPSKITIWRLEHRADQFWTSADYDFSIDLLYNRVPGEYEELTITAIVDGKFSLLSWGILIVGNLIEGTTKNYRIREYFDNLSLLSHQMSLASLRDCKSTIFIDQDCQVVES